MTPAIAIESLTVDYLRETCPTCNGTGEYVEPRNRAGFGQRFIPRFPALCDHRLCRDGKIPTPLGLLILKFIQEYKDVPVG